MKKNLIGLSLSYCCEDMANGKVHPDQVKVIISRTSIRKPEDIEECIAEYSHWAWCPEIFEKASAIFRQMFAEGKVEQPRITEGRCPSIEGMRGRPHWVTNRKQIKWRTERPSPED